MAAEMATKRTHGYTFHWKIEHLDHSLLKKRERLDSPTFTADEFDGTKWSMRLYSKGDTDDNYVGFFLYRDADCSGPDRIKVGFSLSIIHKDGTVKDYKYVDEQVFFKNKAHGFTKFMPRKNLFCTEKDMLPLSDTLKLECTLWTNAELFVFYVPKNFYARTLFKEKRIFFYWRIDKFNTLKQNVNKEFRDNLIDFHLVLKETQYFEKTLIININSIDENIKYLSITISFTNSEGEKEKFVFLEYFADDLKKGELHALLCTNMEEHKRKRFHKMDVLFLDFQYVIPIKTAFYESSNLYTNPPTLKNNVVENSKDPVVYTSMLAKELKFLYNDAIFSDTELRTQTKTFAAHKNILSARSAVFRRMFSNDMKEKNTGYVNITDFDEDTVHRMLLYMYTDSIEGLQFESASNLYRIADKYEIISLKSRCFSFLKEILSPENACDVLVLADLHNDDDLKIAVQDYILGKQKEVFCSQEWKHFMETHLKLAADVMYKKIYQE